jgi:hypothetical protein
MGPMSGPNALRHGIMVDSKLAQKFRNPFARVQVLLSDLMGVKHRKE